MRVEIRKITIVNDRNKIMVGDIKNSMEGQSSRITAVK